jgi:hypothetical protein
MTRRGGALIVAVAVLVVFAYALYETQTWSTRSRTYGIGVAALGLGLAAIQVGREALRLRQPPLARRAAHLYDAPVGLSAVGWAAAFYASLWLAGLVATVPLFAAVYLRLGARTGWPLALGYAAAAGIFVYAVFVSLLHIPLPTGVLVRTGAE